MATYNEALDCMCRRCMNFAVCNATGCEPKRKLQELIDSVNEKIEVTMTYADLLWITKKIEEEKVRKVKQND